MDDVDPVDVNPFVVVVVAVPVAVVDSLVVVVEAVGLVVVAGEVLLLLVTETIDVEDVTVVVSDVVTVTEVDVVDSCDIVVAAVVVRFVTKGGTVGRATCGGLSTHGRTTFNRPKQKSKRKNNFIL